MTETKTVENRVSEQTPESINRKIAHETAASVAYYASHPSEIGARLEALEQEWGIERVLIANASTLGGIGLGLGFFVNRRWFLLTVVVLSFLLHHGLQGWCPPLPIFRSFGVRTKEEILRERYALRALRGDLAPLCEAPAVGPQQRAQQVLRAVNE